MSNNMILLWNHRKKINYKNFIYGIINYKRFMFVQGKRLKIIQLYYGLCEHKSPMVYNTVIRKLTTPNLLVIMKLNIHYKFLRGYLLYIGEPIFGRLPPIVLSADSVSNQIVRQTVCRKLLSGPCSPRTIPLNGIYPRKPL